ncbi:WG repeat-containing protein [Sporosarcina sp. FSL K6-3457]|uniref:WG repeat-containing protein n=1 Tax=Sporosarcina sp. FSL K6-3457 TaxID=2978204 RepID=UPI0030FBCF70
MENNFRKFLTMILAMTLIITVMPFNAYADTEAGEFSYTEIITPTYEDGRTFSEGLAAVKRGNKWGYINEFGEVVIDFQYDHAHSFSEGKALVEKHIKEDGYVRRYYYIITPDNKSIQLKYGNRDHDYFDVEIYDTTFYNGYILVPADTPNGRFVFDEYGQAFDDSAFLPTEGTLAKYNYYRTLDEEYVILYEELGFRGARPFNQGMAPVRFEDPKDKNGHYWSFLKKDGTLWSGSKFYDFHIRDIRKSNQVFTDYSLASLMNSEGKWGAVNKEGETILPFKYEQLRAFSEGVAAFSKNGKFGFIDIHGNEVIKPQFDDASAFVNGLAVVRQGKTAYIIDKQGNKVKGSETIPVDAYFVEEVDEESGEVQHIVYSPGEYIVIKENNKFGIGKINYTEKITEITGVSLDHTELELEEGEAAKLLATVSPIDATNKNLTWSSSNEEVAVVDAYGKVTAQSIGETTITVTTEDGKYTATSEVIVRESTSEPDPYEGYKIWDDLLGHDSINHSWTIKLNMNVDENTVDDLSVYIIDKDNNKLDFIHSKTENSGIYGSILLRNNGSFKTGEDYWIIIEDTVRSIDGKRLDKGLKAQFKIK